MPALEVGDDDDDDEENDRIKDNKEGNQEERKERKGSNGSSGEKRRWKGGESSRHRFHVRVRRSKSMTNLNKTSLSRGFKKNISVVEVDPK